MNKKIKIAHTLQDLEDQIILTLKDTSVLQEDDDVLQNDQVQYQHQIKHNLKIKEKLNIISNAASSHLQAKNQGQTGILPHYDDYSYKAPSIQVNQGVVFKPKKTKSKSVVNDYQSHENSTKLNSQYSIKKQKNNKQSTAELLSFLQNTAQDDKNTFKRELDAETIIKESLDNLRKKIKTQHQSMSNTNTIENEDQSFLLKSIQNARKKTQINKPNSILEVIKQLQQKQEPGQTIQTVEVELNPISYKSTQNIRKQKTFQLKQALSGSASVLQVRLPTQRLTLKNSIKQQQLPKDMKDISKQQLEKMRQQVKFLQDRSLGLGLSQTLKYLRENALIGKQEQVGRYNDKSLQVNDPNDRIKLQYRNASGKLMKPKQAFRYICAKFHGTGPSKNKIQMRKRRQMQQVRIKQQQSQGGGQLLKVLEKHQQKTGEAHIVLNLGGKKHDN